MPAWLTPLNRFLHTAPLSGAATAGIVAALLLQGGAVSGVAFLELFSIFAHLPLLLLAFLLGWQALIPAAISGWGMHSVLLSLVLEGESSLLWNEANALFFLRIIVPALLLAYMVQRRASTVPAPWLGALTLYAAIGTVFSALFFAGIAPAVNEEITAWITAVQDSLPPESSIMRPEVIRALTLLLPGLFAFSGFIIFYLNTELVWYWLPQNSLPLRKQPVSLFIPLGFIAALLLGADAVDLNEAAGNLVYYSRNIAVFLAAPLLLVGYSVLSTFFVRMRTPRFWVACIHVFIALNMYLLLAVLALGLIEPFQQGRRAQNGKD